MSANDKKLQEILNKFIRENRDLARELEAVIKEKAEAEDVALKQAQGIANHFGIFQAGINAATPIAGSRAPSSGGENQPGSCHSNG